MKELRTILAIISVVFLFLNFLAWLNEPEYESHPLWEERPYFYQLNDSTVIEID